MPFFTFLFKYFNSQTLLKNLTFAFIVTSPFILFGQNSISNDYGNDLIYFEKYHKSLYHEVIDELEYKRDKTATQALFFYLSKQVIGVDQSDQMKLWVKEHASHPLWSLAAFKYAEVSFYKGDTLQSRKYIEKVIPDNLSVQDQALHAFMSGVFSLQGKRYENANVSFEIAMEEGFEDTAQIAYYQAFTNDHLNNYEDA